MATSSLFSAPGRRPADRPAGPGARRARLPRPDGRPPAPGDTPQRQLKALPPRAPGHSAPALGVSRPADGLRSELRRRSGAGVSDGIGDALGRRLSEVGRHGLAREPRGGEDAPDHPAVLDRGSHPHPTPAAGTAEHVEVEGPPRASCLTSAAKDRSMGVDRRREDLLHRLQPQRVRTDQARSERPRGSLRHVPDAHAHRLRQRPKGAAERRAIRGRAHPARGQGRGGHVHGRGPRLAPADPGREGS